MATSRHFVTPAIVLRRRSVGEKDRSILLFTKMHGVLWATARGVKSTKSRRASHLEPFNVSMVTFHMNGNFTSITDAASVSMFGVRTTSFLKMRAYYLLSEIIERLIPSGVPHAEEYDLYERTLSEIFSSEDSSVPQIMERSITDLLVRLGYIEKGKFYPLKELFSKIETIIERKLRTISAFRSTKN